MTTARRRFLGWLAASPLVASAGRSAAQSLPDPAIWAPRDPARIITSPADAQNVFDFEPAMRKAVSPAHFGYMATGTDDEATLRANRAGFQRYQLRPRRLIDVSQVDTSIEIFGERYPSPIAIAPTASNRAFHEDGELAVARAARRGDHLQMLSTVATTSVEAANEARGRPVWFQLYPTDKRELGEALARRAEAAGCRTIVVTVDVLARQNWETYARLWRADGGNCGSCHGLGLPAFVARKPNFAGLDISGVSSTGATSLTWDTLKRLRDVVKTRLVVKGLLAPEDAVLASRAGMDGIIVSNHGGRSEDNGGSTIEVLPEVVAAAGANLPVLVDSGFRRGTDIVKALAIGARAVCIGRPYLWGLGAFGQPGVERVLEILQRETRAAMMQMGAPTVKALVPALAVRD